MKRLLLVLIALSITGPVFGQQRYRHRYASSRVIFYDDFNGASIDATKWTTFNRIGDQDNGELNCVVAANASVSGGILSGIAKFEDRSCGDSNMAAVTDHYTSWQLQQAAAPFLYGTVEVRAKIPGGIGIWPCIWMLGFEWQASQPFTADFVGHNWPHAGWAEIDIAEFMSNVRTQVNNAAHVESSDGAHLANLPYDATTRFMVYRLQWTSTALVWSVDAEDGNGFQTLRSLNAASGRIPTVAMYVVLNMAVGGIGGGTPDSATFPLTMQVDYVRVTQ